MVPVGRVLGAEGLGESSTCEEFLEERARRANSLPGKLGGYDCEKCLNRGFITVVRDGAEFVRVCECMKSRRSLREIEKSGLGEILEEYTFERFRTPEPWQQRAKAGAMDFVERGRGWFFMGGASGAGKTHLCTAICGELLRRCGRARSAG